MSAPVYERVLLHDSYGAPKAATKTASYHRCRFALYRGGSPETTDRLEAVEIIPSGTTKRFRRQTYNYRPLLLRPWTLLLLFLVSITLIGVLEWAVVSLPHRSVLRQTHHASSDLQDSLSRRSSDNVTQLSDKESAAPVVEPKSGLDTDEPRGFIIQRSAAPSASDPPAKPVSPPASIPPASIPPASTPPASAPAGSSATPPAAFVQSQSASQSTFTTINNAFVQSTSASSSHLPATSATDAFVRSTSHSPANQKTSSVKNGNGNGNGNSETGTSTKTDSRPSTTENSNPSTPAGQPSTLGNHGHGGQYSMSASGSSAAAAASASAMSNGANSDNENHHTPLRGAGTFASSYLPTIGAVLYRMLWSIISNSFALVEPFRLLARPEGAPASVAFFSGYQSKPTLLDCMTGRKWALGVVTLVSSLADLLPALASESVYVNTDWLGCPNRNPKRPQNPCPRRVEVLVPVLRSMQALLAFACVILLWLFGFFFFRNTGLLCDPRSMTAVASLMGHETLLHDLNRIPGDADLKDIQRLLSHTQYRLAHFEADSGEVRYGVEPGTYSDSDDDMTFAHKYDPVEDRNAVSSREKHHRRKDWILDLLLAFVLLGTFGVVLAYHLDYRADSFNNFFNSGSFGPGFILTLAATVIATLWKRAEISIMVMAPYERLAKKPSSSDSTVLFKATTTPLVSTARAFHHGYFVVAIVTIVTIIGDLALNVVIGGVPYERGQSLRQSLVSRWLSMSILIMMFLASIGLLISRLRTSYIPRRPDTLGAVMGYLAGGQLPYELEGTDHFTEHERERRIRTMRKKYRLSETKTASGTWSWTIDEVHTQPQYYL